MRLPRYTAPKLLALITVLAGCTPTKIHLHTKYLSEDRLIRVTESLESAGFEVVPRDNRHPAALLGSILVYRPDRLSEREVARVTEAVANSGFFLNGAYPAEVGGHHYTEGNMGLYLVDADTQQVAWDAPGYEEVEFSITDFELKSTDCERRYLFNFQGGGELELRALSSGENPERGLRWEQETAASVAVYDGQQKYLFRYLRYQRGGTSNGREVRDYFVELEPEGLYPLPYACSFRAKLSALVY
ncbi:hypothetical protein [Microbulbifer sediminum]|uniref:hypothetical protein n=1 Tax=Microbulbifer sediminum TaxID=2904250 RepID=UPI001F46D558|nr:hypothetical protein [Microbulbifer sediminum]